jgi:hypothetical protein
MLGLLVITASVLVTIVGIAAGRTVGPAARRWSRWLRWAAFGAAVVTAAALASPVVADSGSSAAVLLGVPVVLAALPLGWDLFTGRPHGAVDWPAAVLAMGWAVLLALGIGLAFVPAALLQLAAAATAQRSRPDRGDGRSNRFRQAILWMSCW